MLIGSVNADREAVLRIWVRGLGGAAREFAAVIDTGFNGYLTLSAADIAALGLPFHSYAVAELADGAFVTLRKFEATVAWASGDRAVTVLEAEGGPLLGMSLLENCRLSIEVVPAGAVHVAPLPQSP